MNFDTPDLNRPIGPMGPPKLYACDDCGFEAMLFEAPLNGEHGDQRTDLTTFCSGRLTEPDA